MTEATRFKSWQKMGAPAAPHNVKSPNLVQLVAYARRTWGLVNLGIYNHRPIRGGTSWSSHAFGAAADLGYTDRPHLDATVLPWLIANPVYGDLARLYPLGHYRQIGHTINLRRACRRYVGRNGQISSGVNRNLTLNNRPR